MGFTQGDFKELGQYCSFAGFGLICKPVIAGLGTAVIAQSLGNRTVTTGRVGTFSFALIQNLAGNVLYSLALKSGDFHSSTEWEKLVLSHLIVGTSIGSMAVLASTITGIASVTFASVATLLAIGMGIEIVQRAIYNSLTD